MITELQLVRQSSRNDFTPGQILWPDANGQFVHLCYTVEDQIREVANVSVALWKIKGVTAIPVGRYQVIIDFSQRFQKPMPHILSVPEFWGIRWHIANRAADVEGCAGVGRIQTVTGVGESKLAFDALMPKLEAALLLGEVWVTYVNCAESPYYNTPFLHSS